jgi:hypothetical protein
MTTIGTEFAMNKTGYFYLHELQEVLLQEVQPADAAVPAKGLSVPVEQKTENFFFTAFELHFGHAIS